MKSVLRCVALASVVLVSACGGRGSSAPAPTGLTATGQDTQITLNWDAKSGVEYRVYCAPGNTVDNFSWYNTTGGVARASTQQDHVLPPFTVDRLQNDLDYACTVDARINGGPAGVSAPSVASRTRWVGDFRSSGDGWQTAASTGVTSLRAMATGTLTGKTVSQLFASGAAGQVRVNEDGFSAWSDVAGVPAGLGDLDVVAVFMGRLVLGGSAGVMASTPDLSSWNTTTLGSAVKAMSSSGARLVAVGASGLIRYSTDGSNWSTPSLLPADLATHNLTSVTYSAAGYWLAVGSSGTVLVSTSADASQWTYASSVPPGADLNAVAALSVQDPVTLVTSYRAVAVGANGTVGYSTDLLNWSWQSLGSQDLTHAVAAGQTLYKVSGTSIVAYGGGQFVLAGNGGSLYRSGDALNWNGVTWTNFSASLGTNANPLLLYRHARPNTLGTTTSWFLYSADGSGRWMR